MKKPQWPIMICNLKKGEEGVNADEGWLVVSQGEQVTFSMPESDAPTALELTAATGTQVLLRGDRRSSQWTCPVVFEHPGPSTIRLLSKSGGEPTSSAPTHILVQPKWIEEICLLTVLPRSLGEFSKWEGELQAQKTLGYNTIHFVPLQTQNRYQSHYGLVNHFELNPDFFPGLRENSERKSALKRLVARLKEEAGIRCVQDVVLNHASAASPLFATSSGAAFTKENTPYLSSALELDLALQRLSGEIAAQASDWYPFGTEVSSEEHIDTVMKYIEAELLPELKLEEFFLLKEEKEVAEIMAIGGETRCKLTDIVEAKEVYKCVRDSGTRRWGSRVSVTQLDKMQLGQIESLKMITEKDATLLVASVNNFIMVEVANITADIIKNVRIAIRHLKIAEHQPLVTAESPLVKPYFTMLPSGEYAALNGFINDNPDVRLDIIRKDAWNYLRRSVFPWRDCVKLRYLQQPFDNPELWQYMSAYVSSVADTFAGIRVDNAHGTPLHVLKYMTQLARHQNHDIVIMVELLAMTKEQERDFFACGVDLLLRESAPQRSMKSLAELIRKESKPGLNSIPRAHLNLPVEPLPSVLFDCTHDSEMPALRSTLPRAAAASFARCAVGSTRGVDDFLREKVSVVGERRLYPKAVSEELQKFIGVEGDNSVALMYQTTDVVWNVLAKGSWNNWTSGILLE